MTGHNEYFDIAWEKATKLFSIWRYARPSFAWFNGYSEKLNSNRVQRLIKKPHSKELEKLLTALTDRDFIKFRTRTLVNLEQANTAFRSTIILNVSLPIAGLALSSQIFPGWVLALFGRAFPEGASLLAPSIGFGVGALIMMAISIAAFAALNSARDLKHLTDLHAANRGQSDLFQASDDQDTSYDLSL